MTLARQKIGSAAPWEATIGYSRLVRVGPLIWVTGTTAFLPEGGHVGEDAYAQTVQIFANLARALEQAGAGLEHVVRTRMFLTNIVRDSDAVGRAHGEKMGAVRPAASMIGISALLEPWMLVEIEVDAYVD